MRSGACDGPENLAKSHRTQLVCILHVAPKRVDRETLAPSAHELIEAARWARTQDSSEGFRAECLSALNFFGVDVTDV